MYDDKTTKLLVELNKLTSSKVIKWEAIEPDKNFNKGSEDIIPIIYRCEYKGKTLALYNKRYKHYYDEHDYNWSDRITFAILSESGKVIWENPVPSLALRDLFEAVTLQSSGLDDLFDDLLN